MGTDERTPRDLLLLLPVETTNGVTNLHTKIAGEAGLDVTADAGTLVQAVPNLERLREPSFRRPLERIGDPQISPTRQILEAFFDHVRLAIQQVGAN